MAAESFAEQIVHSVGKLRAHALRLTRGRRYLADDLVQETVLRGLLHADQFTPGTNLQAWLYTILRNAYYNENRFQQRFTELGTNLPHPERSAVDEPQMWNIRAKEIDARVSFSLSADQREAIMLVAVNGYSYEDAARGVGCATGTMKSRVSRARSELGAGTPQRQSPRPKHAAPR